MRNTIRALYASANLLQKLLDVRLPMGFVAGLRTPQLGIPARSPHKLCAGTPELRSGSCKPRLRRQSQGTTLALQARESYISLPARAFRT
jgi:hypothetical protein